MVGGCSADAATAAAAAEPNIYKAVESKPSIQLGREALLLFFVALPACVAVVAASAELGILRLLLLVLLRLLQVRRLFPEMRFWDSLQRKRRLP